MIVSGIRGYIPWFFVKKGIESRSDYFQINLGYSELLSDLKYNIKGWFLDNRHDLYLNMLQVEMAREAGFFTFLHILIDLEELKGAIE